MNNRPLVTRYEGNPILTKDDVPYPVATVHNAGMVCTEGEARKAGVWFCEKGVDIVFCHTATYAMSASHLPIAQICSRY